VTSSVKTKMKVLNVVGARPNFMKMAPIIRVLNQHQTDVTQVLVHTGQHYDEIMSGSFFRDLEMPRPDVYLDVRGGTHAQQTAQVMLAFEDVLIHEKPDWVIVVGDVNSTLACTLVASKLCIPVAHVEAGLRSFDRTMPEEINRLVTDRLSDLLLTPSQDADENLLREGIAPSRIARVGNVMIDTLHQQLRRAKNSNILAALELEAQGFAVLTLHRPANVDNPTVLHNIFSALAEFALEVPIIFPVHPRTKGRMDEFNLFPPSGVRMVEPLGYRDFLHLWSNARLVLTDSGGLQEETTALGIPCLTLRENTERPVTIEQGTNQIVGRDPHRIVTAARDILENKHTITARIPELWDGHTADRIVAALLDFDQELQRAKCS
jgi:UDP-N-acetylglucosamine 2-epimerase (non-hydrolysing)